MNKDWGWSAVAAGGISAATFMLGYYTGGAGSIASTYSAAGLQNYANTVALGYAGKMVFTSTVNNFIPPIGIQINDYTSISVSPSIAPEGLRLSATVTMQNEYMSVAFGANTGGDLNYGINVYGKNGATYSWYRTDFGGEMAQGVGGFGFSYEDFSLRIDEDHKSFGGDGDDRYRTGGFQMSYKNFVLGARIMTNDLIGEQNYDIGNNYYKPRKKIWQSGKDVPNGVYNQGKVLQSMGWIGYKSKYGVVSFEHNNPVYQHLIQNSIHKYTKTPYFQSTNFNYYSTNIYRQNPFSIYFY